MAPACHTQEVCRLGTGLPGKASTRPALDLFPRSYSTPTPNRPPPFYPWWGSRKKAGRCCGSLSLPCSMWEVVLDPFAGGAAEA